VGTKKLIGDDFSVKLGPSVSTLIYDPRGISTGYQLVTVQIVGPTITDSVVINQVGKVIRQ
jgi:hypothetical protein